MAGSSRFTRGRGFFGDAQAVTFTSGNTVYKNATVALTSANILAMNATPVTILADPGTGLTILVDFITFKMVTTATAYANGGTVQFNYNGGSVNVATGTIAAAVVNAGAGTSYTTLGPPSPAGGTTLTANKGVKITNNTAAFITGTGTAVVYIEYRVVTLP